MGFAEAPSLGMRVYRGMTHYGGLGYLYLAQLGGPEFQDSGNVGQLDLVLSLEWVQHNITQFGGDPSRVLVFGESGGGAKNACLMEMPKAMGLFQRACSSSGETVTASPPHGPRAPPRVPAHVSKH